MIKVGLIGYGRAGAAVARVIDADELLLNLIRQEIGNEVEPAHA